MAITSPPAFNTGALLCGAWNDLLIFPPIVRATSESPVLELSFGGTDALLPIAGGMAFPTGDPLWQSCWSEAVGGVDLAVGPDRIGWALVQPGDELVWDVVTLPGGRSPMLDELERARAELLASCRVPSFFWRERPEPPGAFRARTLGRTDVDRERDVRLAGYASWAQLARAEGL